MNHNSLKENLDLNQAAHEMHDLLCTLYPICRSITGNGLRETLNLINNRLPLQIHEIPTGTRVFDWTVPREWNIRDAYIKDSQGKRVIDFCSSNLHVVGYSMPVHRKMSLSELQKHLYTLPHRPDWIPYRTTYYQEDWGFCLSHNQLMELKDDEYEVVIDSSLENGHLTYGECLVQGSIDQEFLISCHVCHPSLCNDNLSGTVLATFLGNILSRRSPYYSYRILFIPGTIGSITWLALNREKIASIRHGLVLACLGDPGPFTYKKSRQGNAEIDQCMMYMLNTQNTDHEIMDFSPYGYDERQYCSPGFNLPVGCLMRTPYGRYPEYHTSKDNPDLVTAEYLGDSLEKILLVLDLIEANRKYLNTNPECEPHLGKRGLYKYIGGQNEGLVDQIALLWVLNQSDGMHSLLDIADKSCLDFWLIRDAAHLLEKHGLLIPCA